MACPDKQDRQVEEYINNIHIARLKSIITIAIVQVKIISEIKY